MASANRHTSNRGEMRLTDSAWPRQIYPPGARLRPRSRPILDLGDEWEHRRRRRPRQPQSWADSARCRGDLTSTGRPSHYARHAPFRREVERESEIRLNHLAHDQKLCYTSFCWPDRPAAAAAEEQG